MGSKAKIRKESVSKKRHPCCRTPTPEFHSDWKDETGLCKACKKRLRYGNGPLAYGAWSRKKKS